MTAACAAMSAAFLSIDGGYQVHATPALLEAKDGPSIQSALEKSGKAVTIGSVALNLTMVATVLVQSARSFSCASIRTFSVYVIMRVLLICV